MNLSKKSQKIYDRLVSKTVFLSKTRMPSIKSIVFLLDELEISSYSNSTSCEKWSKASGCRYYTSGGARTYNGHTLRVPSINLNIDTTDTYYSWNTWRYAEQIVKLVDKTLQA